MTRGNWAVSRRVAHSSGGAAAVWVAGVALHVVYMICVITVLARAPALQSFPAERIPASC